MKRALFIDRDGTIITEPVDEQIDSFEKLKFVPDAISALRSIRELTDYDFVMVSNQDGLGTDSFPESDFWPVHNFILQTLEGEKVTFSDQLIDRTMPADNAPTRKPGIAMLSKYLSGDYDLANSFVIGDRDTDAQMAANIGCRALILSPQMDWNRIAAIVVAGERSAEVHRVTAETDILVKLNLDGTGKTDISTGLGFFDHMLSQISHHGNIDLTIVAKGDLNVDEHHTVEDTAIALGQCLKRTLGDKKGIERYGFCLPMDDCLCRLAMDFGGRPWLVWDVHFSRERIGDVPTELFFHFFKSLSDNALINLNIQAQGENEHHLIESVFKAFARALKLSVHRDLQHFYLPSSKGLL